MAIRCLAVSVAVLVVSAACAGNDGSSDNGSEEFSVCDRADVVQQGISDLAGLDIVTEGLDGLKADLQQIRVDLEKLRETAGAEVGDEADDLEESVKDAADTLTNLGDQESLNAAIDEVQLAFTNVVNSAAALTEALSFECG